MLNNTENNFLSVIWNIVQMGTSIVCCCGPIFQSIFPKVNFFTMLRSWISQTLIPKYPSARKYRSESIGVSPASSDIYQGQPKGMSHPAQWVPFHESGERSLAWADIEASHEPDHSHAISPGNTIEMKTVIHQSVKHSLSG
ncbi:hypothetical protein F4821DRAFT_178595 [Hypoxylon rubiginosum]|uniref:Uncharacterized protein n=1 Tax=Hypoxylon rubiginosum TaxID=110542 RepID=A0ACC0CV35_9PEZI|nr:hypothetical protein F4821DRAFT_178595 [Hypoxylon rubiginosum]